MNDLLFSTRYEFGGEKQHARRRRSERRRGREGKREIARVKGGLRGKRKVARSRRERGEEARVPGLREGEARGIDRAKQNRAPRIDERREPETRKRGTAERVVGGRVTTGGGGRVPTGRRGRRRQRAGRPRLPRERDEKLESVMGRGETYETDVNFERRERGVSVGGGNEPSWWR